MILRHVEPHDHGEWLRMRRLLLPQATLNQHLFEMEEVLSPHIRGAVFVVARPNGRLAGFLEVSIRAYADGCESRDVGYLEGWFVDRDARQHGWGRKLIEMAETWAVNQGCEEMASDTDVTNQASIHAHRTMGYRDVAHNVHFVKRLRPPRHVKKRVRAADAEEGKALVPPAGTLKASKETVR